jgi:hypothetical protein
VRARLSIFVAVALPLTAADLLTKAVVPTDPGLYHLRSSGWRIGSAALLVLALVLCRLPSRFVAAAAGVFAAGVAGNLVSALGHDGAVPNPFVAGTVAFTLADVLLVAGVAVVGAAGMRLAVRHRHLLPTSTIPVRIARYVRGKQASSGPNHRLRPEHGSGE